jgi:hypothetical protein
MPAKCLTLIVAIPIVLAAPAIAQNAPAAPAADAASELAWSATLSGASEVDAQGAGGKGDADGTGSFSARLVRGKIDQFCYTLTTSGIDEATMAHIHKGEAGANGPVFIGLPDLDPGEHCLDIDDDRAGALKSKPQAYYVNVHNGDFPGGAVRGQLARK